MSVGIVMGSRNANVVVDEVVATEFADDSRHADGITRGEQLLNLIDCIDFRTVVGSLVQVLA